MTTHLDLEGNPVHVKTNGHARPVVTYWDLPEAARPEFDYVRPTDRDTARFVAYRGAWYDLAEFVGTGSSTVHWVRAAGFDAWQTESAFSAVIVRWFDEFGSYTGDEHVVIGYAHW
jgi:hypothetical protein